MDDQQQDQPPEPLEGARAPGERFDEAIRAAVVARCLDGDEAIMRVAAELGVPHRTAWAWVKRERVRRLDPDGELPAEVRRRLLGEQQKVARLERENAALQRQLEFAKKAAAFFQETDQRGTDTR